MKILHIYDGHDRLLPEGSVPTTTYKTAQYAARIGHEVTALERRWQGLPYTEEIDGITFERLELRTGSTHPWTDIPYEQVKSPIGLLRLILNRVEFAIRANKWLKRRDFDIVHAHLPFAAAVLVTINRQLRQKMVYTAHIGEEKKRLRLDSSAPLVLKLFSPDIYLMKRVRKTVVENEAIKSVLEAKGIRNVEVIHPGVEVADFVVSEEEVKAARAKHGGDRRVVMFSGTITPRKGIHVLLGAARQVKADALYLLVGSTSMDRQYASRMMQFANANGLRDSVSFTGHLRLNELKPLYQACDVFVLPSLEEGFGAAMLEAMASGKPLIGSRIGGITLQIRDGWNGFLVEPGNEKELAEKMQYLLDHPEERQRMGENSRRLAEQEFAWTAVADRHLKVYETVAARDR